jgi:acetolactate synthase-1/2/3 large subunit
MSYYVGGGHYFARACKIQLDDPHAACAMDRRLPTSTSDQMHLLVLRQSSPASTRNWEVANRRRRQYAQESWRIATEPADSMPFDIAPGVLDPRDVIVAIDAVIPKDWDIVVGGGH